MCSGPVSFSPKSLETPPEILKVCNRLLQGDRQVGCQLRPATPGTAQVPAPKPTAVTSLATQDLELGGLPQP